MKFSDATKAKARKLLDEGKVQWDSQAKSTWWVQGTAKYPYGVQLTREGSKIRAAKCSCKYGQTRSGNSECSHVAAVLLKLKRERAEAREAAEAAETAKTEKIESKRRARDAGISTRVEATNTAASRLDPAEGVFTQGDRFNPDHVVWVTEPRQVGQLVKAILASIEVVIDLETTGLDQNATGLQPHWPEAARIVCASLTLPVEGDTDETVQTWVVPLSHPDSPLRGVWRMVVAQIAHAIKKSGLPVVNANLKFDMKYMHALVHVDLSDQLAWDTQIGAHLLDENESTKLKERVPKVFGVERWDDHDLSTPAAAERVPVFDLCLYAARDTFWDWKLANFQRFVMNADRFRDDDAYPNDPEEAQDMQLGYLAEHTAMPTARVLTEMEQRGLKMDTEWVDAHIAEEEAEYEKAYAQLANRYPMTSDDVSFHSGSNWFKEWTTKACEAEELEVTAMTGTGQPQWDKAVLTRQAAWGASPVPQMLLDIRQAGKRLEYLHSWQELVTPASTIHTNYHAGKVVTGRLSSSSPNVQQITSALKPAFVAREGYVMGDLDFSQIELRVGAFISRCEAMLEAYRNGEDLHKGLAADIAGIAVEAVTADQRQKGKAGNFGFLYGMSAHGFVEYALTSYGVHLTELEAALVRQHFFDKWEGLTAWHARTIASAHSRGYVTSPIGRVRRLPHIHDRGEWGSSAERQAINSPVQGFASDLMQMAAASIAGKVPGYPRVAGANLVGTVHDSIVVELLASDWENIARICMGRMTNMNPMLEPFGVRLDVPLAVEAKVGNRWGTADLGVLV